MADLYPDQYLTKTEASQQFNRSERSLSRDVRRAIIQKNKAVLVNAKLQLEDGQTLDGPAVQLPDITRLVDEGKNPTWLFRVSWLQATYGKRGEPRPSAQPPREGAAAKALPSDAESEVRLPAEKESRLAVLEALFTQQGREIRSLHRLIEKQDDREERNRMMQEQSNLLMKELSGLVRTFLDANTASRPVAQIDVGSRPTTATVDAELAETIETSAKEDSRSEIRSPARGPADAKKRRSPSKPATAGTRKKPSKVSAKEGTDAVESSFTARHLPTLSKLFSRRRS